MPQIICHQLDSKHGTMDSNSNSLNVKMMNSLVIPMGIAYHWIKDVMAFPIVLLMVQMKTNAKE